MLYIITFLTKNMQQCKKCVLAEHKPDIWLNDKGICNACIDFEKRKSEENNILLESELIKILNKYRGKGKYDCLVMCSGGKDSTSSLYYMKKRYKLNPLAFTFEHGFENEEAIANVKRAVSILNVDWLYFESTFMKDLFAEIIKTKSKAPVCPLCSMWYMGVTYEIAAHYNIPLIIAGWTRGQLIKESAGGRLASELEFMSMTKAVTDFVKHIRKIPKYKDFPESMKEVTDRARKKHKTTVISPHWFLNDDPEDYQKLIKKELEWKPTEVSYPKNSTNCYLNFLGVYLSMKYYGFTHYHIEMAKFIRSGELSREEALRDLEINFDEKPMKSILESVIKKLGCSFEDIL